MPHRIASTRQDAFRTANITTLQWRVAKKLKQMITETERKSLTQWRQWTVWARHPDERRFLRLNFIKGTGKTITWKAGRGYEW